MSAIEWTDATWNPVLGCTPVSTGCLNCYAATMANRLRAMDKPGYEDRDGVRIAEVRGGPSNKRAVFTGSVRLMPDRLTQPLGWKKPRMVFVNSMSDLFHEDVPFEFIDRVFAVMALSPEHTFQVLTKRPGRMAEYLNRRERLPGHHGPHDWRPPCDRIYSAMAAIKGVDNCTAARGGMVLTWPLPNVWLGTSCENQATADERIPHLLRCPAAVRFLSCEPLVGPVDLNDCFRCLRCHRCGRPNTFDDVQVAGYSDSEYGGCIDCGAVLGGGEYTSGVDWVIVGGESGHHARPCDVRWIQRIVDQCQHAGVPVFVKQLGGNIRDRNDAGFEGENGDRWDLNWITQDVEHDPDGDDRTVYQGKPLRVRLEDRKGGNPDEWPDVLRVREMPKAAEVPS